MVLHDSVPLSRTVRDISFTLRHLINLNKNGARAVAEEKQEHLGADLKDVKKMKYAELGLKTTKEKNTTRNDKYLKAINTKKGEEFRVVQEVVILWVMTLNYEKINFHWNTHLSLQVVLVWYQALFQQQVQKIHC